MHIVSQGGFRKEQEGNGYLLCISICPCRITPPYRSLTRPWFTEWRVSSHGPPSLSEFSSNIALYGPLVYCTYWQTPQPEYLVSTAQIKTALVTRPYEAGLGIICSRLFWELFISRRPTDFRFRDQVRNVSLGRQCPKALSVNSQAGGNKFNKREWDETRCWLMRDYENKSWE